MGADGANPLGACVLSTQFIEKPELQKAKQTAEPADKYCLVVARLQQGDPSGPKCAGRGLDLPFASSLSYQQSFTKLYRQVWGTCLQTWILSDKSRGRGGGRTGLCHCPHSLDWAMATVPSQQGRKESLVCLDIPFHSIPHLRKYNHFPSHLGKEHSWPSIATPTWNIWEA